MNHQQLNKQRHQLQIRIAVWCVLTICFTILNMFKLIPFLQWVMWIATLYTVILIVIWVYLTIQLIKK